MFFEECFGSRPFETREIVLLKLYIWPRKDNPIANQKEQIQPRKQQIQEDTLLKLINVIYKADCHLVPFYQFSLRSGNLGKLLSTPLGNTLQPVCQGLLLMFYLKLARKYKQIGELC